MGIMLGYLKPDLTIGYRPSNDDVDNAVFNIENGILVSRGGGNEVNSSSSFAVVLGKPDISTIWHNDLTSAVLSPEISSNYNGKNDSLRAVLYVKKDNGYQSYGAIYVRDESLSEGDWSLDIQFGEIINLDEIRAMNATVKEPNSDFLKELQTVLDENEFVAFESLSSYMGLQRYLVNVSSPVDVFVDAHDLGEEQALLLSGILKSEVLPYQYLENGDMVLNPNGAVLTYSAFDTHLKGSNHIRVSSKSETLDFLTAILLRLVSGYEGSHKVEETALLYKVLTMGIKKGIYHPLSNDRSYDINKTLEREELRDVLIDIVEGRGLTSLAVLALVIDVIFRNNLFDVQHKGIPKLSDKISRVHFAELFDSSVSL